LSVTTSLQNEAFYKRGTTICYKFYKPGMGLPLICNHRHYCITAVGTLHISLHSKI